ncbi:MAG TPA: DUF1559 domain-containing protein [Gemmataceae bacterium]|nr:DUF1559 domain-containing protein [Gemmataceae bacterium]
MRRLSLLFVLLPIPAYAQPAGAKTTFADLAAPFIDEHTLIVARVDISRIDLDTVLKLFVAVSGQDAVGEDPAGIKGWVKEFVRSGGRDVFVTYGSADFPNLPALIVPAPADAKARETLTGLVRAIFKENGKDAESIHLHGCLCVGTKDALAVLRARKPADRPDLKAAIEAGRNGVVQLAFAMSADARKIHEQVAPTLPAELGGGGIQKITRGMKWMAITVASGPKMPAKWVTEAASPEAAQDLKAIEARAQKVALAQLLKAEGQSDIELQRKVLELFAFKTTVEGSTLTTEWDLAPAILGAVKLPQGPPADRVRSANNLKQLMLALHNYHDAYDHFPTDIRDKDGKPLLSWRVRILPYVEHEGLYRQFKLNEPWDSEHNKKLIAKMPKVFRSPRQADTLKDQTTYLAPLGPGFIWDDPKGVKISQITDGTSNTIALVEADDDRAVVWTRPADLVIDSKDPTAGLLGHYGEGFHAAIADGSVRFIRKSIAPMSLWAMFTRAGGEVINEK